MPNLFQDKLRLALAPALESLGYELVGCELQSTGGQGQLLKVFIDKIEGVTIDDCARASHQIRGILDVENTVPGDYRLEVSSPGLDRPLYILAHYQRFLGSRVKIRMREGMEGRRHFTGQMIAVDSEQVTLLVDGENFILPMSEIDKANLIFESPTKIRK